MKGRSTLYREASGAIGIQYALVISLIAIATIGALTATGSQVSILYDTIVCDMGAGAGGCGQASGTGDASYAQQQASAYAAVGDDVAAADAAAAMAAFSQGNNVAAYTDTQAADAQFAANELQAAQQLGEQASAAYAAGNLAQGNDYQIASILAQDGASSATASSNTLQLGAAGTIYDAEATNDLEFQQSLQGFALLSAPGAVIPGGASGTLGTDITELNAMNAMVLTQQNAQGQWNSNVTNAQLMTAYGYTSAQVAAAENLQVQQTGYTGNTKIYTTTNSLSNPNNGYFNGTAASWTYDGQQEGLANTYGGTGAGLGAVGFMANALNASSGQAGEAGYNFQSQANTLNNIFGAECASSYGCVMR